MVFLGYHCGFEAYLRLKQNPRYQSYLQVLMAIIHLTYVNVKIKFKCLRFKDARRYVPYFQRNMSKEHARANLRKMLEDVGFEILHCSLREKTYEYNKYTFKSKY